MLYKIIDFSINNKLIIALFIVALIGLGIYESTKLPIDAVPDITNNQVQIITVAPSFGANDIERLVTFPIEQANSNIDGIKEIRSFSRFGLSLVTIVFEDASDIYWARQQVAERLLKVQALIPKNIGTPELGPITTGLGEIYQYVLHVKKGFEKSYDITELRTIQDWLVRRQLLGVKGVAEVSSFGGKLKQYEVAVNPSKLQSFNLSINDVFTALEKNNQNTGGAYIEKGPTVIFIRSEGLITNQKDIENISVGASQNGVPIFIKDLANVNMGFATRYGAMYYNDEGEVAGGVVMMLKGANSSEVIKNVKARIQIIEKNLPSGVSIEPFLDRTKMVNNSINTVEKNLMEGALIVVFILVLFLGNIRAGLLVASVIPLALLFAIIMMNVFGVSGNLMSLGALDFGLIVDGAVIIVEAVMHQLTHSKTFSSKNNITQTEMNKQVSYSAGKMMNSAVFGQIIILIVYLPIFTLQGIEGKMFKPMAQTVAFSLIGAFLLSVTYIPMMSSIILSKKIKHKPNVSDKIMFWIERKFQHSLFKILSYPKLVITSIIFLFISSVFVLSTLGGEFIPALEEGDFAVDTKVLTGSNLNTTVEYVKNASHILLSKFPEVKKVVTKIGSGEVPTDPMPLEAADMMIILKDKSEWTSANTFPELSEKMSTALKDIPGMTTGFQYPVQMRFNELMTGARQDAVCKIFGEDLDTLAAYAIKLGNIIKTVDGAQDLYIEPIEGMPQIVIKYNRPIIAQYDLSIDFINNVVNSAFAGQMAGSVFEGEKRFDVVVRLDSDKRKTVEDLENLLIPTPEGIQIPLHQLATITVKNGPNQIQREDAKRRIVVGFNVRKKDVQTVVNELQQKVNASLKFPTGYYVNYGGAFKNLAEAKKRLFVAVPISLLLIFLLLFFTFNSVKHGLLIYTAIPLSAIGGILFLALRGMPFSISAGVGFIALFGVSVLNGIVLVAEFNRLKKNGYSNLHRIVLMGTKVRLRPVLMTAFVASLGFLPMALSNGAGAEVQRPLATVVIGGLMLSTFLTLYVLPILYIIFEKIKPKKLRRNAVSISIVTILLLFNLKKSKAQESIDLQKAVEIAKQNNLMLKNEKLTSEYEQKMKAAAIDIPQTNFVGEYGQMNSLYRDNRFGISQSISFPTVYSKQKTLQNETYKNSVFNVALKEAELKKQVSEIYYQLLILNQKKKLLQETDSAYESLIAKTNARFSAGESNMLEKATADSQRKQIAIQLKQLLQEIEISELRFQLLLNNTTKYLIRNENYKMNTIEISDSSIIAKHPSIQMLKQQKGISMLNTQLEKAKLLPTISFGYSNMTMQGVGADNVLYHRNNRFASYQFGLGLPLFYGSQSAKINSAKTIELITENKYQLGLMLLKNEYSIALKKLNYQLEIVEDYENKTMKDAEDIIASANSKFSSGDISFLEWMIYFNNAIAIRSSYLEAVNDLNLTIISIQYLTTK